MNKSERKKEVRKSRIRILQKIQYSAFFLMLVEVVIWAATKMSPMLLVVILLTCAVPAALDMAFGCADLKYVVLEKNGITCKV